MQWKGILQAKGNKWSGRCSSVAGRLLLAHHHGYAAVIPRNSNLSYINSFDSQYVFDLFCSAVKRMRPKMLHRPPRTDVLKQMQKGLDEVMQSLVDVYSVNYEFAWIKTNMYIYFYLLGS